MNEQNRQSGKGSGSSGHGEKYPRKWQQAIAALLTEPTAKAAAERVGVSERCLRLWQRRPEFATQYQRARTELFESAMLELEKRSADAARVLAEIANDKTAPQAVRVSAAGRVLELTLRMREMITLERRVQALEKVASGESDTKEIRVRRFIEAPPTGGDDHE